VYDEQKKDEAERQLRDVHVSALAAAADRACASIAFPAISTGAYRFPIARAAELALDAVADFQRGARHLAEVRFVLFSARDLAVFERALLALTV
jgi:O-acetyl-ADP-ribose deacetylase